MDEKEALRIAKVMKQNAMITTRRKNSNTWGTHPEKTMLRFVPKAERTSLRGAKDKQARCNVKSVCGGTTSNG
jgi:hypothetical protein